MKTHHINFDERLAEHFTLREMIASGKAMKLKIDNTPDEASVARLRTLCQHVLEPIRRRFGRTIVSSGYRCKELNDAVGGVDNSQHLSGQAADIHCSSLQAARQRYDFIRQHLDFDQLLLERRLSNGCCWLHVSYVSPAENRRMARFLNV
jgi:hypothetical protein